jgi:transposase-like protein
VSIVSTREIVHTIANEVQAVLRTRREYSAELKAQVVQACRQPGASVASVAMAHSINANVVRLWLREPSRTLALAQPPAFVPISLTPPAAEPVDRSMVSGNQASAKYMSGRFVQALPRTIADSGCPKSSACAPPPPKTTAANCKRVTPLAGGNFSTNSTRLRSCAAARLPLASTPPQLPRLVRQCV